MLLLFDVFRARALGDRHSGDADDGVRIGVGGLADGRGFVFVVGATLAGQLVDAERIVDVVRIGADGVPVRKSRRQQQTVMVIGR